MLTWTPSFATLSIQAGTLSLRVSWVLIGKASQDLQKHILIIHDFGHHSTSPVNTLLGRTHLSHLDWLGVAACCSPQEVSYCLCRQCKCGHLQDGRNGWRQRRGGPGAQGVRRARAAHR